MSQHQLAEPSSGADSKNENNARRINICDKCGVKYLTKRSLTRHVKLKHLNHIELDVNSDFVINNEISDDLDLELRKYKCNTCNAKYDLISKLLRHMKIKHSNVGNSFGRDFISASNGVLWYKCENCDKSFMLWKSLLRHHRLNHSDKKLPIKAVSNEAVINSDGSKFKCWQCEIIFTKEEFLDKHITKYHSRGDSKRILNLRACVLCNFKSIKSVSLFDHYFKEHKIEIIKVKKNFNSLDEFQTWKNDEERKSLNMYVMQHGTRRHKNGIEIKHYYCHRSGTFKNRGTGKRRLKNQGSKKFGKMCPAKIIVKIENNKITVDYVATHIGHESDICHLTLSHKDRKGIADKIMHDNVSFDEILNDIHTCSNNNDHKLMGNITRKDLHNIVKSFNIKSIVNKINRNNKNNVMNKSIKKKRSVNVKEIAINLQRDNCNLENTNDCNVKSVDKNMIPATSLSSTMITPSLTKSQLYYELHELVVLNSDENGTDVQHIDSNSILNAIPISSAESAMIIHSAIQSQPFISQKPVIVKEVDVSTGVERSIEILEGSKNAQNLMDRFVSSEQSEVIEDATMTEESGRLLVSPVVDQSGNVVQESFSSGMLMQSDFEQVRWDGTSSVKFEDAKESYLNNLKKFLHDCIGTPEDFVKVQEFMKPIVKNIVQSNPKNYCGMQGLFKTL